MFRDPSTLGLADLLAVRDLQAPFEPNQLLNPDFLIGAINERSCEKFSKQLELPANVRKQLEDPAQNLACPLCTPELISMLDAQMHQKGLVPPQKAAPFTGASYQRVEDEIAQFYQPELILVGCEATPAQRRDGKCQLPRQIR